MRAIIKVPSISKVRQRKLLLALSIFIVLYVVSLFLPFISSYTQYPLYMVKCEGSPLVSDADKDYFVPGSKFYRVTGLEEAFFCNEQEAQAAGYEKFTSRLDN